MDLRRATLCALGVVVGCTLLLLLASTGLLQTRPGNSGVVIAADGVWAGILAGIGSLMWPYMQISSSRPDTGYRHRGLPGLVVLGVLVGTVVNLAVMSLWPLIVGDRAAPDAVIATLVTNPLSLALVAFFLCAMQAWSVTCTLGFVRGGWNSSLAAVVVLLVLIGVGIWQGTRVFENPPTIVSLTVWWVLAVLAVGVLAVVAALAGPDRSSRD